MKNFFSSIKTTLVLGLFLGTLIPIFIAGFYTIHMNKIKLYKKFDEHREKITSNIASSMKKPIYEFSPNGGSLALNIVKHEKFIVSLNVYNNINEMNFLSFDIPQRKKGDIYKSEKNVLKDGEVIGEIEVYFSDFKLQQELRNTKIFFIKIFTVSFFVLLIVMYPLLYKKVFNPLQKLQRQTNDLKDNNLEKKYFWNKNDEISQIGKSFDDARQTIKNLINKLTLKNNELERLYVVDRLTGLYNRYKLDMSMEYEKNRANRYENSFGVVLLDIDYFKQVNDKYGHQVGDSVLIEFADILRKTARKTDIIGRWGGEEFLIIVPEISLDDLIIFAEKLRLQVENHNFKIAGKKTASLGVSLYDKKQNLDELISNADKALYKAKENGRNRVCF